MPTVSKGIYKWLIGRGSTLEDFADRLNHFWTFGLLLLLACIISWKQVYNRAINCWAPAQFTDSMVRYTEETCWNSYFIVYPRDEEKAEKEIMEMFNISVPHYLIRLSRRQNYVHSEPIEMTDSLKEKMSTTRTLYQWLPIILCFQALLFKLPNLLMYIFHGYSGLSFDKISGLTTGYKNLNLHERDILGRKVACYIISWCGQCGNWLPCRLISILWLLVKVLYCVNIVIQISLVDSLLKTTDIPIDNSKSYGDVISGNLFQNNATIWKESPAFPRTVLCSFSIQQFNNIHTYTVQCNLTANYFNEYVYMFIWVWLLFVAVVTCLSLAMWTLKTIVPIFRMRYIEKAMKLEDDPDMKTIQTYNMDKFCNTIGEDGVMTLKLIGANTSELFVSNVVCNMWKLNMNEHRSQQPGQILSVPEVTEQTSTGPFQPATSSIYPSCPPATGSDIVKKAE